MKKLSHIFGILLAGVLLSSCASYYYKDFSAAPLGDMGEVVPDDDVYLKRDAEVAVLGDAKDPTSFNNYKAGRAGAFATRGNHRNNNMRFYGGMGMGYGGWNSGWGMHNSWGYPYYGYNSWGHPGYGYNSWGHHGWGSPGWGYNSWGNPGWGHHGWGHNSWGNPGWGPHYGHGGWNNWGNTWGTPYGGNNWGTSNHSGSGSLTGFGAVSMGPRQGLTSSSSRSSNYPSTMKSGDNGVNPNAPRRSDAHNNINNTNSDGKNLSTDNIIRRPVTTREYATPQSANRSRDNVVSQQPTNARVTAPSGRTAATPSNAATRNSAAQSNAYRPSQNARTTGVRGSNFDRTMSNSPASRGVVSTSPPVNRSATPSGSNSRGSMSSGSPSRSSGSFNSGSSPSRSSGFSSGSGSSRSSGMSSGGSRSSGSSGGGGSRGGSSSSGGRR